MSVDILPEILADVRERAAETRRVENLLAYARDHRSTIDARQLADGSIRIATPATLINRQTGERFDCTHLEYCDPTLEDVRLSLGY